MLTLLSEGFGGPMILVLMVRFKVGNEETHENEVGLFLQKEEDGNCSR